MSRIYVQLFNMPVVFKEGKEVFFPYVKVKALFYYLIVEKKMFRDEAAGMLWSEENDVSAKKNLRNAIYIIKKIFGKEIITCPQKSIIMVNPDADITTDIDLFNCDNERWYEVYRGEFLRGLFLKNSGEFENWIIKKRTQYKEKYIEKLHNKIDEMKKKGGDYEIYAKSLIETDEFDEDGYRNLMMLYIKEEKYKKAIELYKVIYKLLESELGITPDGDTRKLYVEAINAVKLRSALSSNYGAGFFFGRQEEMETLKSDFNMFINGHGGKSIIILGDAGIGKTALKNRFIHSIYDENIYFFESDCFEGEKEYLLKPWNSIVSKISEVLKGDGIGMPYIWEKMISEIFPGIYGKEEKNSVKLIENIGMLKYQFIGDVMGEAIKKLTLNKKVVFVFDDIQWMDYMSISLLSSIILHENDNRVIFIAACRDGYDRNIESFICNMKKYDKLMILDLKRFSKDECRNFIEKAMPSYRPSDEMLSKIYHETEGNTFFLIEYLNAIQNNRDINIMSSKMQDVIKSRFSYISEDSRKILNIASMFLDEIDLDVIEKLTGRDELEIMDIVDGLKQQAILKEIDDSGRIILKFTHEKLREFVYIKQPECRKKVIHSKIAAILEERLKEERSDIEVYNKLIYHYSKSDDAVKVLKYKIKSLNYYLDFSHELFPILEGESSDRELYFTKQETIKMLKDVEKLLKDIKRRHGDTHDIERMEAAFLHLKGRYMIREGDYEEGTSIIIRMIEKSLEIHDKDYALEGYKQMIYYSIQTDDRKTMIKYIELALELAIKQNYHKEIGVLLRLKGLYNIMCGEFISAENLLKESINTFGITRSVAEKYAVNIAAAYNYIGEIRRFNLKFSDAISYYDRAIKICKDKEALSGLAVFNINAGQAAFDLKEYEAARKYFENAYSLYKRFDSIWRKSIAQAFLALLYIKDGRYSEAFKYLKDAEENAWRMKNSHEMGLVLMVKAEIRLNMESDKKLYGMFSKYLDKEVSFYKDDAITYLKESHDSYEIDVLQTI